MTLLVHTGQCGTICVAISPSHCHITGLQTFWLLTDLVIYSHGRSQEGPSPLKVITNTDLFLVKRFHNITPFSDKNPNRHEQKVVREPMNQVWIFLTVGFGMSLLLVVVIITMVLCCLVTMYHRREEKYILHTIVQI